MVMCRLPICGAASGVRRRSAYSHRPGISCPAAGFPSGRTRPAKVPHLSTRRSSRRSNACICRCGSRPSQWHGRARAEFAWNRAYGRGSREHPWSRRPAPRVACRRFRTPRRSHVHLLLRKPSQRPIAWRTVVIVRSMSATSSRPRSHRAGCFADTRDREVVRAKRHGCVSSPSAGQPLEAARRSFASADPRPRRRAFPGAVHGNDYERARASVTWPVPHPDRPRPARSEASRGRDANSKGRPVAVQAGCRREERSDLLGGASAAQPASSCAASAVGNCPDEDHSPPRRRGRRRGLCTGSSSRRESPSPRLRGA
jgi:hypothetical protein